MEPTTKQQRGELYDLACGEYGGDWNGEADDVAIAFSFGFDAHTEADRDTAKRFVTDCRQRGYIAIRGANVVAVQYKGIDDDGREGE